MSTLRKLALGLGGLLIIALIAGVVVAVVAPWRGRRPGTHATEPARALSGAGRSATPPAGGSLQARPPARPASSGPPVVLAAGARASAQLPTTGGLGHALNHPARAAVLGHSARYEVADLATGRVLLRHDASTPQTPASVTKLTTVTAVLAAVGPAARIKTTVVAGRKPGTVVLVGGGDPTLTASRHPTYPGAARIGRLAAQVRAATRHHLIRTVVVDDSAYSGPRLGPGWDNDLVGTGNVAPITPVMIDGGRTLPYVDTRTPTPDLAAGHALARALAAPGARVINGHRPSHARLLGTVESPPISTLVEQCLQHSDNVLAEALARQVAMALGRPASFAGAAAAVRTELTRLGFDLTGMHLNDGSGLSRRDRLTPRLVVDLLLAAADPHRPALRSLITGLPVAGYSGTLGPRYHQRFTSLAAGDVRAKTGSLSGVNSLAGLVTDASGRTLVFAILDARVSYGGTFAAEDALDRMATTLAQCGCRH